MSALISQPCVLGEENPVLDSSRPQSGASDWSDYNLEWLFDPDRYDHLPIEEQLKLFKQRNLKNTKFYKCAAKIWGAPPSRRRVIIAQPSGRLSPMNMMNFSGKKPAINSELKPQTIPEKVLPIEVVQAKNEKAKLDAYHNWINDRKSFRKQLDTMGPSEEWLSQKPNKTPLEQRVLTRMIEERTKRPPTPPSPEAKSVEPVLPEEPPIVRRNCPLAIKIIEKFLHKKKMRLIDLFQSVDKDKSWTVTRREFRQAIKQTKVPISDVLLEDLILTLDLDFNDELDYREMAKGMDLWKIEKRESKRQMVLSDEVNSSPTKFSKANGYDPPEIDGDLDTSPRDKSSAPTKSRSKSKVENTTDRVSSAPERESVSRARSAVSTASSASTVGSRHLEAPPPDTRQEQLLLSSDEAMLDLRKQNRETLSRYKKGKLTDSSTTIIKTMDEAADRHLVPTTLTGDTADLLHKFRQLKYREYNEVCNLCLEQGLPLTESLLQKVLLYPADKPHQQLKKHLRQPAMPLISKGFHRPQPPTKQSRSSPDHVECKVKNSKNATKGSKASNYTKKGGDRRQAYLSKDVVRTAPAKQHLSTGKALVSNKIDCWMTFEEYDRLTSHLGEEFVWTYGPSDDNAFWPGHLLDKLRLCMPDPTPKTTAIFSVVRPHGRYH